MTPQLCPCAVTAWGPSLCCSGSVVTLVGHVLLGSAPQVSDHRQANPNSVSQVHWQGRASQATESSSRQQQGNDASFPEGIHVAGCHSLPQRPTTELKAVTRECPSLPSKETLAGRLQGVPCPCGSPAWLAISEPGGTKKPPFRGAFHSPGRHQLRPWGPKALNFLSSMT